jgi:hypothetical protein
VAYRDLWNRPYRASGAGESQVDEAFSVPLDFNHRQAGVFLTKKLAFAAKAPNVYGSE